MIDKMNRRVSKMDIWDIGLTKLAVATGILFVITIWPAAMDLVHSINPWWFFAGFVVAAIRPMIRFFGE